ncbi:lamin tail domain-containing protein [Patescibacteria group bacterium]|nr:lamin tail domain-containing protein [Patescibacteria group bacterium]
MASPANSDKEWVEFYNTSSSNVDITQWAITELTSSGNVNAHILPSVIIPPSSSCFFEFSSAIFNNNGDTVSLNNSSGTQIDNYTYTSTVQGKTFSRIPDGGNWQIDATDPTKSNTDCNHLPSPPPSSTPSPALSPTPSPISTSPPSSSFTINNIPSQINSDQSFSVNISLSVPNNQNTEYYLKGAFKKADGTRYLGLTKIGDNWVEYGDDTLDQFKITTNSSGNWTGNLEVKPDIYDKDYKGKGDYIFKVARLTSGDSIAWSNEAIIIINDTSNLTSSNPSPLPTLKNELLKSPTPSILKSPTPKPTQLPKDSYRIASVAGTSSSTKPTTTIEIKDQKQINPLFWLGLILILIGVSLVGYIYLKKNAKIHI